MKVIISDGAAKNFLDQFKMACNAKVNKKFKTSLNSKLQPLFSATMLLVISLTTIPLVTIQSEAQPLLSQQEGLLKGHDLPWVSLAQFLVARNLILEFASLLGHAMSPIALVDYT